MPDMLVKLYTLPPLLNIEPLVVRRALAPEKHVVVGWIRAHFGDGWASEADVAMCSKPVTCFVALCDKRLVGFACYDTTRKGFFGPTGVDEEWRGKQIGRALLLACLHDMNAQGYGYAIIGAAGPTDFYAKCVGAIEIPDSWPGVYAGMLRE